RKMSERRMAALKQNSLESESEDAESTYHSFADGSTSDISASANQAIPIQNKNYHKSISENKEIVKLVSVLSTSINSTKKDHSENPLGAAVTLAHELGHNFGMNHDTPERGCGCRASGDRAGCIMTPSTRYPFPTTFSSCSQKDLVDSLGKGVGMCLFNTPEIKLLYGGQKCGNGYVEEGEQCDCGDLEECLNPCCNASTCTLKEGTVCAHGQCCEKCQLKPAGIACRESSNSCDLPEFCTGAEPHCPPNVYLHDGQQCQGVNGHCYNSVCQTHEQQCVTLWGQGATPAPGICFERVNSAGDPYGNCGKDAKGSFAKCEARDAQCGKIQCQGGANRPVIGTNAVSIETNIPLKEGGRILCRGTHVYLGDDLPDPGLVLTGTKCGEKMMCINRRCQNISVLGVNDCSAKCSGHGVCNNLKNCHCEVILLCCGIIAYFKRKTLLHLFISKKISVEKLRSPGPNRLNSAAHTLSSNPAHSTCTRSQHTTAALPNNTSIRKQSPVQTMDSALPSHRISPVLHCPPLHLAHTLPLAPAYSFKIKSPTDTHVSTTKVLSLPSSPSTRATPSTTSRTVNSFTTPLQKCSTLNRTPANTQSSALRATQRHPSLTGKPPNTHSFQSSLPQQALTSPSTPSAPSNKNICRIARVFEKPVPPQKPLPADPLTRVIKKLPANPQTLPCRPQKLS
ncbi:hypothetical protein DNTS_020363, partial [Danionella cerebrum]